MSNSRSFGTVKPGYLVSLHRSLAAATSMLVAWAARCRKRSVQRRALAQLDDRLLRDVGLDRTDVATECGKSFWLR